MLAVVVRGLLKNQSAFLFDCCVIIVRFASLSCYSSAKTRIRPVKSYQKAGYPEDKVNPEDHETYRSGVGTLLYLTKHSRPDISNPVRELSKTMDAPATVHLKEMYKVTRHVLSTKGYGLKFELRKDMIKWALKALSDSDFASDKETRISVFGYIIYFCGIPIAWRSKGMKSVVLSTTEAEYMALSEVVKELKFIVQLLQTMNIEVELPITVHVDNVGAIWLSNNRTTSDRTKHIDIRTSFVKEYQEDGKIIIKFVKSEENEADIFTCDL